jgi:hypothetical protein
MKRAFLIFYLAVQPAEAAACHRFHHWAYPWPQRCSVAVARPAIVAPVTEETERTKAIEQLKAELRARRS